MMVGKLIAIINLLICFWIKIEIKKIKFIIMDIRTISSTNVIFLVE